MSEQNPEENCWFCVERNYGNCMAPVECAEFRGSPPDQEAVRRGCLEKTIRAIGNLQKSERERKEREAYGMDK